MVDWDGTTFTGGSYSGSTDDDRDDSGGGDDDDDRDYDGTTFTGGDYSGPTEDSRDSDDDSDSNNTSSDNDDDDDDTAPVDTSNPGAGLSGGGGVSDTSPDNDASDEPLFTGGDNGPATPDEPSTDIDNPFDDSDSGGSSGGSDVPVGNTPSSGNLPSNDGDDDSTPEPTPSQDQQLDGSQPTGTNPLEDSDVPAYDVANSGTPSDAVIDQAQELDRPIRGLEDSSAAARRIEQQTGADVTGLDVDSNETVVYDPGQGAQVVQTGPPVGNTPETGNLPSNDGGGNTTPEPTPEQEQQLDGSQPTGGDGDSTPEPTPEQEQQLDGSQPTDGGTGQNNGNNDGGGIVPDIVNPFADGDGPIDASEIVGDDGAVTGSDIDQAIDSERTIRGLGDSIAGTLLSVTEDVRDPTEIDVGDGQTVEFDAGEGVSVVDTGTDETPDPTAEQDQMLDGSQPTDVQQPDPLPDSPDTDTENPFDGSGGDSSGGDDVPVGNTPSSGNLPSNDGDSPDSGQGIGPDGVSGSEAATPDSETDAPTNDATENIDVTGTGQLEENASGDLRDQAESLEQQVTGQQITDVVDGLTTTGAEFREEDIAVTRDGNTLEAGLSEVGEARIQNIAERQQDEQAERAVENQLNTAFDNQDVAVDSDGDVSVSQDVENEATEQALAEQNPGVREDDIGFEGDDPQIQQPQDPLGGGSGGEVSQPDPLGGNQSESAGFDSPFGGPAAFENETGLDQGEDFTVQRNDGNVTVNVTQRGAQELQGRQEQEEGDALTPIVEDIEGVSGIDLPGNTSEAGEARVQQANDDNQEVFGGRGEVEQGLRDAADSFSSEIVDPLAESAGDVASIRQGDSNPLSEYTTEEQQADIESSGMNRAEAEGVVQGVGGLANLPQLGVTGIEAGEVAAAGVDATAVAGGSEQDFEQFESDVAGGAALRGVNFARQADENPAQLTGQLVGGTVASTGLLTAGQRLGGSAGGRAAAGLVQPGEELLQALRRSDGPDTSTSAASGTDTQLGSGGTGTLLDADNIDDGRGPSTGSRVRGRIQRSDTYQTLSESLEQFRRDTSGQLEFAPQRDRGRSGGDSSPDAPSDFDPSRSEILEGSARDQLSGDVSSRARTQRQQNSGTFDGGRQSDPGRTRAEPEGTRRRREQAQRQEVTEPPRTPADRPEASGRLQSGLDATAGLGGALAGSGTDQAAVQQPSVTPSAGFEQNTGTGTEARTEVTPDVGLDVGVDTRVGVGLEQSTRLDTRTETRTRLDQRTETETRTETRLDERAEIRQEFRTEARTETPTEIGFDRRFELEFPNPSDDDELEFPTTAPSFEDVEFNNAVATPSEVLGVGSFDTSGGGQGGLDDEFDVSGGLF